MADVLYIVVPCYNEEDVFASSLETLLKKLTSLVDRGLVSGQSRLLFVNDGSRDKTWSLISAAHEENEQVCGLSLSRNKGHQAALFAGLCEAAERCDMSISIDADLQDDIGVIDEMVEKYNAGADVVYGVRDDRKTDSFAKRATAQGFYKIMTGFGAETVYNHADFRLMSKRAMAALSDFSEYSLYLRGLVPMIGYKTDTVYYKRLAREAGVSKYPSKRMWALAGNGVYGFSSAPVKMIWKVGIAFFAIGMIAMITSLVLMLAGKIDDLYAMLFSLLFVLSGIQMIAVGVVGQYVVKINDEVRRRPRYFIADSLFR